MISRAFTGFRPPEIHNLNLQNRRQPLKKLKFIFCVSKLRYDRKNIFGIEIGTSYRNALEEF